MKKETQTPVKSNFVRLNSRVSAEQLKFIKSEAKRKSVTEGEMNRIIIDFYIKNSKK